MHDSPLDQEYLDKFAEFFNEDYPNHHMTRQQIDNQAMKVLYAVQFVYKPIPKAKEHNILGFWKSLNGHKESKASLHIEVSNLIPASELT